MRKTIARFALAFALLAGGLAVVPASPASAGQGYWSTSSCRPDVWWINYDGYYGTEYYWYDSFNDFTYNHWVEGGRMNLYQQISYQCGVLGPPTSNYDFYWGVQYFQNGYIWKDWTYNCYRYHYGYDYYSNCVAYD